MLPAPARGVPQRAGFTLLELLAVVLILAILAGILVTAGRRATEVAKIARARSELAALAAGLEAYRQRYGDYPQTDSPAVLLESLTGRRDPHGTRIDSRAVIDLAIFGGTQSAGSGEAAVLLDPWERPYRYAYRTPAAVWTNSSFVLFSAGPDGQSATPLLAGGFPDQAAPENTDNIHALR